MKIITRLENKQKKDNIPQFVPGDSLRVHIKVVEGGKERIQIFEGIVLRKQGGGLRETFTVRKISHSVGVEKTFPLHSPSIANIEVIRRGDVNRAKLYYLRKKVGRAARVKEKRY